MDHLCYFCLVSFAFMYICMLMPCGHLLGKGWPVMSICDVVTFPLVSWVRSIPDLCHLSCYNDSV